MFTSCKQYTEFVKSDVTYYKDDDKPHDYLGSSPDSIFKVNIDVDLYKRENPSAPLGLQINAFGAFDVYWDGVLVGSNGKMAKSGQSEVPGTEMSYYQIPEKLAGKGKHIVTITGTQTQLRETLRGIDVKLESYLRLHRAPLIVMSFMNLMAGAFLIASIYYFFLYINSTRKEATVLLFAIICLLFFCLLIIEYIKFYIDIPYTHFYTRLQIVGLLTFIISILVPWYFMLQFGFKRKRLFLFLLFAGLVIIYVKHYGHYDKTAIYFSYVMCFVSIIIAVDAAFRKIKGGVIVVAGLLASIVVNKFIFYDFGLFISFTIIVLSMLYLHTIKTKALEEAHNASLLLSSRLQLELVKKNIQPHFLRNTLTSLIDWIEESPQQGIVFIRALADEFDIMNSISEETLIPVRQEIELCKKHLEVMSFRKELSYKWEEKNIDENEEIPPAIIHTIIENGITHSLPSNDGSITFCLSFIRERKYKQYTLRTVAKNRNKKKSDLSGTGFKYIKARLNESYGNNWQFDSFAVEEGWLTEIKIFDTK
ncbi:histidine kinase [Flavobacterium sp. KACC 22758]|uniref:histidine kinase n=1 Tax=Flavobacterium sp. KACC 22758 TaxID=3025667 RepID=UPI0023669D51|nr:histidine kinase [Flavobacterium sp. KACC 22758]WDF58230.1 histidine kinase [Flavobacterium sp. KACC 22758]